jgi:hypothetical protein
MNEAILVLVIKKNVCPTDDLVRKYIEAKIPVIFCSLKRWVRILGAEKATQISHGIKGGEMVM